MEMLQFIVCAAVLQGLGGQPGSSAVGAFGDRGVEHARDALSSDDSAEALLLLEESIPKIHDPNLAAEASFLAARASLHLGLDSRALAYLEGLAESLAEARDYVWYLEGVALRSSGDWHGALQKWKHLLAAVPSSPLAENATYGIADAYYALGMTNNASAAYELALARYRRSDRAATAKFNRARLAENARDYGTARNHYRSIAFRDPLDYFADLALERFNALASRRLIRDASFYDRLGRIDRFLSARALDPVEAELPALEDELTSRSRREAHAYRLAQLHYRRGRYDAARSAFDELAASASGSKKVRYRQWVSRALAAQNRFEDAIDVYVALAREFKSSHEGRTLLYKAAWLSYNGEHFQRARELFDEFSRRFGDNEDVLWFTAWTSYRLGEMEQALEGLRTLRARYPRSKLVQRALYWEGRVLSQLSRHDEAIASFEKTVASDPVDYYAVVSRQRIRELVASFGGESSDRVAELMRPRFASLESASDAPPPTLGLDSLAGLQGHTLDLPFQSSVLDWDHHDARRALLLMKLGYPGEAADLVRHIPARRGVDGDTVTLTRARLLHAMGDYTSAYRIAHVQNRSSSPELPKRDNLATYQLLYPLAHMQLVAQVAEESGLSPLVLLAVMRQESAFDDRARSWASARGLMQIIPPTASQIAERLEFKSFHPGLLNDPQVNLRFGAWYLKALIDKYGGNPLVAIGSYNAGPVAMTRWLEVRKELNTDEFIEEIPYTETRSYVKRIAANLAIYEMLYGHGDFTVPGEVPQQIGNEINF